MARYIPVQSDRRKDCEAGSLDSLGEDSFIEACIRATGDCGYVLKVITYDHRYVRKHGGKSIERYYREWKNEVEVLTRINKLQEQWRLVFSPKLYDSWYCHKGGYVYFYILMEKYEGDLFHLADGMTDRNVIISMALRRMDASLAIIHHKLDICLNDIKMAYKKVGRNGYEFVFSDFGIATQYSDEECIEIDRANLKALIRHFNFNVKMIA